MFPLLRRTLVLATILAPLALAQLQPLPKELVQHGNDYFQQNCAFCHGRDAGGGETGPDLTRSKIVASDVAGNQIGAVVRGGRVDKGMPAFNITDADLTALAAYLHAQKAIADNQKGGRKGVDTIDLQTGNAEAGKAYFNGDGHCASCHSATGDLAHIASKYEGLKLEERMLNPEGAPAKVTVKLKSGQSITGRLAYLDEFTVGLRDDQDHYHSWPTKLVQYSVDDPASEHAKLLAKYTDDDIHNLMAYLQTLK